MTEPIFSVSNINATTQPGGLVNVTCIIEISTGEVQLTIDLVITVPPGAATKVYNAMITQLRQSHSSEEDSGPIPVVNTEAVDDTNADIDPAEDPYCLYVMALVNMLESLEESNFTFDRLYKICTGFACIASDEDMDLTRYLVTMNSAVKLYILHNFKPYRGRIFSIAETKMREQILANSPDPNIDFRTIEGTIEMPIKLGTVNVNVADMLIENLSFTRDDTSGRTIIQYNGQAS